MAALPIVATISRSNLQQSPYTGPGTALIQFHGWSGWVNALNVSVDREKRIGQDGTVAQAIGKTASDRQVKAYRFEKTFDLAKAFAESIEALPSPTPYTLTDPWSRKVRIRVIESSCEVVKTKGPVDGTSQTTHCITCSLTVERTTDV